MAKNATSHGENSGSPKESGRVKRACHRSLTGGAAFLFDIIQTIKTNNNHKNHKNMITKTNYRFICASFLLLVLLFLFGCGSSNQNQSASYNFKQGFDGLSIIFLENSPPSEVYPNSEFKIIAQLENKGAYDVKEGKIALIGNLKEYLETSISEQPFSGEEELGILKGRSLSYPAGETAFVEFLAFTHNLYLNAQEMPLTYFIKATYQSEMEFGDTICLNPNLYAVYDSGCQIESEKSYSGQGAPLAVNSLQEIMSPGPASQVEFRLSIGNRGNGKIQWMELQEAKLGGKELNCFFKEAGTGLSRVNFKEDKEEATLICRQPLLERNSYTTSIYLRFTYSYELNKEQKIKLVR
ncbi:hypothetical protein J4437_01435 [Candidatus Woesearchaeota archaeon]|nr:hypothetical protein [Candidatus Woesearchaeota archaeon]